MDPADGDASSSVLISLLSGKYPTTELTHPSWGPHLGADPTENTTSNSPSIVVMGGCLAIAWISLTSLPAINKQCMVLLTISA
jgi:hypothetical protein